MMQLEAEAWARSIHPVVLRWQPIYALPKMIRRMRNFSPIEKVKPELNCLLTGKLVRVIILFNVHLSLSTLQRLIGVQDEDSCGKSETGETPQERMQRGGSPAARGKRSLARKSLAVL
jgi:hypothetical protein